jgi:hypothetical protein
MEIDFSRESLFINNPPYELAEQIARYFERRRRIAPTSTMVVFVVSKWAKVNELTFKDTGN